MLKRIKEILALHFLRVKENNFSSKYFCGTSWIMMILVITIFLGYVTQQQRQYNVTRGQSHGHR